MQFNFSEYHIKIFIISLQIAILGIIGLNFIGITIPILRELIGFLYLVLAPGFLIFKLIGIKKVTNTEKFLYTVGLSLFAITFLGLFLNFLYPTIINFKPIALLPIVIFFTFFNSVLYVLVYVIKKDTALININIELKRSHLNNMLFLLLIVFCSIIGSYFMNNYNNNLIFCVMLIIVGLIPIMIIFNRFFKEELYVLGIYTISLALILHTSLISSHVWGWDIQVEYYLSNFVLNNGYWSYSISNMYNSTLSVTLLPSVFAIICGMRIEWVFKIIYPLLYSLLPVGMYVLFKRFFSKKIAFLSCFLFISYFVFYVEILQVARQQIAELFFILLFLLLLNMETETLKKSVLSVIFSFSLIVSHYGLAYIYLILLILILIIYALFNLFKRYNLPVNISNKSLNWISVNYVILFLVLTIVWYMSFPGYNAFQHFVLLGDRIYTSIFDLMNPSSAEGIAVMTTIKSVTREIIKYLILITQFFVGIGLVYVYKNHHEDKIKQYLIIAFVCFFVGILGVFVPYFGSSLNVSRLYYMILVLLAPFSILGGLYLFKLMQRMIPFIKRPNFPLKIMGLFLFIFLMFNSGLVTEILNEKPYSISLNKELDNPLFTEQEISGSEWLNEKKIPNSNIYADEYRYRIFHRMGLFQTKRIYNQTFRLNSYIYLGYKNTDSNKFAYKSIDGVTREIKFLSTEKLLINKTKFFDSGNVEIWHVTWG